MLATAPGFELDVERGPDWLLVRIRDVDPTSERTRLADHLWGLLQQHFTYRLLLELEGVGTLSSYLVGEIVDLYQRIEAHDGVMRLCGLSSDNRRVLHACHLDDRLPPYFNREEAVMGRHSQTKPR